MQTENEKSFNKDSIQNTLIVATVLCLVCSLIVSSAAVMLKARQDKNVELDRKNNLLKVCGCSTEEIEAAGGIMEMFDKKFEAKLIDLNTGEAATAEQMKDILNELKIPSFAAALTQYDQMKASKLKPEKMDKKEDIASIKKREDFSHVYLFKGESGTVEYYVFPIRGLGLWSMCQGFLAVEPDFQTIAGIAYYDQKETPGLGGEIVNPNWVKKWPEKKIYGADGSVSIRVVKGSAAPDDEFGVDGLSGATITSNGVSNMLKYWMGPSGFGPFIEKQKQKASGSAAASINIPGGSNG